MSHNLSRKQLEVLSTLQRLSTERGYMPSVRELSGVLELSPATTQQHLNALRRKGFIESDGTAHGMRILIEPLGTGRGAVLDEPVSSPDAPEASGEVSASSARAGAPALRAIPRAALTLVSPVTDEDELEASLPVPILGRIAAGSPIEAIELKERTVPMPSGMARAGDYLLHVRGNSMIEDGILDGDLVLIRPQHTARNGEVVVGLLEDGTATLKRFYREANRIRLQPANQEMQPLYVDRLDIQGRLVGLLRRY